MTFTYHKATGLYILKVPASKFHATQYYLKKCSVKFTHKADKFTFLISKINPDLAISIAETAALIRPKTKCA